MSATTFNLPAAAFRALLFASTDENRVNLVGLRVEATAGNNFGYAVATDGHRLLAVRFALGQEIGSDVAITISPDAFAQVVKTKAASVEVELESHQLMATLRLGQGTDASTEIKARLIDANYPDWRQVLTKPARVALGMDEKAKKPSATCKDAVGINIAYLADFATYLQKLGVVKGSRGVAFHAPEDAGSPFTLIREDSSDEFAAIYIVMPMRV